MDEIFLGVLAGCVIIVTAVIIADEFKQAENNGFQYGYEEGFRVGQQKRGNNERSVKGTEGKGIRDKKSGAVTKGAAG